MSARKFRNTWWIDFHYNKVRYRKRSPLNTRDGALDYEATIRQKLARGESLSIALANGRTFASFAEEWMKTYVKVNNRYSEQVSKGYKLRKHIIPFFGHLALHEVNEARIEKFKLQKREEGLSPKTINNFLTLISKCLQTAQEWDQLAKVPKVRWLRVPPPKTDFLTTEECKTLLAAAEGRSFWHDMILCGVRTGLRLSELIALTWGDIDLERRNLNISRGVVYKVEDSTKSNRSRTIPLCNDIYDRLAAQPNKTGRVFPQVDGQVLTYGIAQWAFGQIRLKSGLRSIGWHTLRHTFASHLVSKGVPLRVVQELLGHSTIQMTMRYAHLAPSTLREAVSFLDEEYINPDNDIRLPEH